MRSMSSEVDISGLTAEERLALLGEIRDTLEEEDVPVSPQVKEELDRRLDDLEGDPVPGIPWEDVLRRIRDRTA